MRLAPSVPTLVFVAVPEGKTVKNRLHLDIRPVGCSYSAEARRGNEFCVLGPLDGGT